MIMPRAFITPGAVTGLSQEELTVLAFSSPQEKCLASQAEVLSSWLLAEGADKSLSSIATTLATGRVIMVIELQSLRAYTNMQKKP